MVVPNASVKAECPAIWRRAAPSCITVAMSYRTNARLAAVAEPPIAEAHGWIAGRRFPAEKPLIDVAQAVPGYPPPAALTRHLAEIATVPQTSRYTEIEGIPPLRDALP